MLVPLSTYPSVQQKVSRHSVSAEQPDQVAACNYTGNTVYFWDAPHFSGGGAGEKIMSKDTTRPYPQTIYKWTAQWLQHRNCEKEHNSGTIQPMTLVNSYVWPVPLPDNNFASVPR